MKSSSHCPLIRFSKKFIVPFAILCSRTDPVLQLPAELEVRKEPQHPQTVRQECYPSRDYEYLMQ
jgi:hypothetical protein